jgi:hypothetical protein
VRRVEKQLHGEGRVVLRASGTEPLIRVMVEGHDESEVHACAEELARWCARLRPDGAYLKGFMRIAGDRGHVDMIRAP